MAATGNRTPEQIRAEIEAERERLVGAVQHLRGDVQTAAAKVRSTVPVVVVLAGAGLTLRYLARRGRR